LVKTVSAAAKHEKETLDAVTIARNNAMAQNGPTSADTQNKLSETLKSLFAVAESYPDLKANQNFLELQRELSDTETKIQASRQFYNTVVMRLNTQIEQFPSNIVANMFSIKPEKMFEIDDTEKAAPQVSF
jgi:LemA protein